MKNKELITKPHTIVITTTPKPKPKSPWLIVTAAVAGVVTTIIAIKELT